jgi:hypothetical protein
MTTIMLGYCFSRCLLETAPVGSEALRLTAWAANFEARVGVLEALLGVFGGDLDEVDCSVGSVSIG